MYRGDFRRGDLVVIPLPDGRGSGGVFCGGVCRGILLWCRALLQLRSAIIRAQGRVQISNSRATLRVTHKCSIAKSQESQESQESQNRSRGGRGQNLRGQSGRVAEIESHEDDWES